MNIAAFLDETLPEWQRAFDTLTARVGKHLPRVELREQARDYLRALPSPIERKNGWQMAQGLGHQTPYRIQHLLGRSRWDADTLRDEVRQYVVEHLGEAEGVLILDETGFVKKGSHSAGVARQYSGTAAKDRQLPDRRVPGLRRRQRARADRPRALPAQEGVVR